MQRGQGALEYLIIIAAVLVVAGVVVFLVSGSMGGQKSSFLYNSCKQSASECRLTKIANPNDPCNPCIDACSDPTSGEEIFSGAIECCKAGTPQYIYEGATSCEAPICGNDRIDDGETCDGDSKDCSTLGNYESGTNAPCKSDCTGYDTSVCTELPPPPECGNGVLEGTEVCDGGSADCSTLGGYETGTNAPCKSDCTGYDTSVCTPLPNQPPTAQFTYTPESATAAPLTVSFDAFSSSDPDGSIVDLAWDFGDGSTGSGITPSHTYNTEGSFDVTLTVTDDGGSTGQISKKVNIGQPELWVRADRTEFTDYNRNELTGSIVQTQCNTSRKCRFDTYIKNTGTIPITFNVVLRNESGRFFGDHRDYTLGPGGGSTFQWRLPRTATPLPLGQIKFKVSIDTSSFYNSYPDYPAEKDTTNNTYTMPPITVTESTAPPNNPPTLTNPSVSPASGEKSTTFTYTITYTDADDDAPQFTFLVIDGDEDAPFTMTKQDPNDNTYTNGVIYTYSKTFATPGAHTYSFISDDGIDNVFSPTYSGPTVTGNYPPTLTNPSVSPASGTEADTYNYTVTYTDADNDAPTEIKVAVDANPRTMTKQDPNDNTYTDGVVYTHSTNLYVGVDHRYRFKTIDAGGDTVYLPTPYPNTFSGPIVTGACTNGQTQSCTTAENCPGEQTCSGGAWGTCIDIYPDDNCPAIRYRLEYSGKFKLQAFSGDLTPDDLDVGNNAAPVLINNYDPAGPYGGAIGDILFVGAKDGKVYTYKREMQYSPEVTKYEDSEGRNYLRIVIKKYPGTETKTLDVGDYAKPTSGNDLTIGSHAGKVIWYRGESPWFPDDGDWGVYVNDGSNFDPIDPGGNVAPDIAYDFPGDTDMLVGIGDGSNDGKIKKYNMVGNIRTVYGVDFGLFSGFSVGVVDVQDVIDLGFLAFDDPSEPNLYNVDGNGNLDIQSGNAIPVYVASGKQAVWGFIEGDKNQLIIGSKYGTLWTYNVNNDGTLEAASENHIWYYDTALGVGRAVYLTSGDAVPYIADWDEDGVLDLLVGDRNGNVHLFRARSY